MTKMTFRMATRGIGELTSKKTKKQTNKTKGEKT